MNRWDITPTVILGISKVNFFENTSRSFCGGHVILARTQFSLNTQQFKSTKVEKLSAKQISRIINYIADAKPEYLQEKFAPIRRTCLRGSL